MSSQADEQGIREAIAHYVEGMRTHDVATMKEGFHEQAILCGYLGDHLIAGPIGELYAWASENPSPAATGERFDCEILSIGVTGRVAIAAVRETDARRRRHRSLPPAESRQPLVDREQAVGHRALTHGQAFAISQRKG